MQTQWRASEILIQLQIKRSLKRANVTNVAGLASNELITRPLYGRFYDFCTRNQKK